MRLVLLFLSFFWGWWFVESDQSETIVMQEICNNGIDDDGDGLIDLNDSTDCFCNGIDELVFTPSSLIPNPSFEDTLCCPQDLAQLSCAKDWIQASSATSDYFHTCGFNEDRDRGFPPMPLPAGDAYIGFLDIEGVFGNIYKEYVGACLNESMTAGQPYTLQFYLGFGRPGRIYSAKSPVDIVLYGTNDCNLLPFGGANYQDCPSKLPGWFEIDRVTLSGRDEWVRAMMMFTPTSDVQAVAIGTSCTVTDGFYYYFLDDLVLNESDQFDRIRLDMIGQICDSVVTLTANDLVGLDYQWYRDGIAIAGANAHELQVSKYEAGGYQVMISDSTDCELSEIFDYYPSISRTVIDTVVCEGQSIVIEGINIDSNFNELISYPSQTFCDSLIEINVALLRPTSFSIDTALCEFEEVVIAGQRFSGAGTYQVTTTNTAGCDSTIDLLIRRTDTTRLRYDTAICEGATVQVNGQQLGVGNYIQRYQNASGCDFRLDVTIEALDTFYSNIDTTLCIGQRLRPSGQAIVQEGSYKLSYSSIEGCDSTLMYHVTLRDTFLTEVDTSICSGDTLVLSGRMVTGPSTFKVYESSVDACDSAVVYRVVERQPFFERIDTTICAESVFVFRGDTLGSSGSYSFQRSTPTTCDSSWEVNLNRRAPIELSLDTTLCFGESLEWNGQTISESKTVYEYFSSFLGCDSIVELAVTVLPDPELDYEVVRSVRCHGEANAEVNINTSTSGDIVWEDGFIGNSRDDLSAGDYTVLLRTDEGCEYETDLVLTQPDSIKLSIRGEDLKCQEENTGSIEILQLSGGQGQLDLHLNGEMITSSQTMISGLGPGFYELIAKDENGCEEIAEITLDQVVAGDISLNANNTKVVLGDTVELWLRMREVSGIVMQRWYGEGIDCDTCKTIKVTPPLGWSEYFVEVIDDNGCYYYESIELLAEKAFYVPNTFSPDGDLLNDRFLLYSNGAIDHLKQMDIYNRWGELVFSQRGIDPRDESQGWDGTFNGEQCMPGVYVYRIELVDKGGTSQIVTGDITLIR